MSISISPMRMVGTMGRSVPDARRVMTIARASSSSGEKGIGQDVVDPQLERPQLCLEIAAPGEAQDRRHAPGQGVRGADPTEEGRAVVVIHVDYRQLRPPLRQDRLRLGQVAGGPHFEETVVQCQLDEIYDEGAIVEDEGPARSIW